MMFALQSPSVRRPLGVLSILLIVVGLVNFLCVPLCHHPPRAKVESRRITSPSLPDTPGRVSAEKFVETWLEQAFDYWCGSCDESRKLARQQLSQRATTQFSEVFWSAKLSPNVVRAMVYRPESCEVVCEFSDSFVLTTSGHLIAYQGVSCSEPIRLTFEVAKSGDNGRLRTIAVSNSADVEEFVVAACKGTNLNICKDAIYAYEEGVRLLGEKEYAGAVAAFKIAVARSPDFAMADFGMGNAYYQSPFRTSLLRKHFCKLAIGSYSRALEINPCLVTARRFRAECYWRSDLNALALTEFDALLKDSPNDAGLIFWRGLIMAENDKVGAAKEFRRAIQLMPDFAGAYYELGRIYLSNREYREAEKLFSKAIQLDPTRACAFRARGRARYGQHRYKAAILDYNESLRGEPESAFAYYWRAQAFQALGDNDCALEDYNLAIQCEPIAENYYSKANFELMLRESLSALYDIEQALKIKPKCLYMQELRSRALLALGRFEDAKQNNLAIVKETPSDVHDWRTRATVKIWLGDTNGAIRDLNVALLLEPLSTWTLLRLSCLHFSQKNYGKAASDFVSAFTLDELRGPKSWFK